MRSAARMGPAADGMDLSAQSITLVSVWSAQRWAPEPVDLHVLLVFIHVFAGPSSTKTSSCRGVEDACESVRDLSGTAMQSKVHLQWHGDRARKLESQKNNRPDLRAIPAWGIRVEC